MKKISAILFVILLIYSLGAHAEEMSPEAFLSYVKNGLMSKAIRSFPIKDGDKTCKLSKPEDIDGIVRVDTSNLKDPNCYLYLSNRYVAKNINDRPGEMVLKDTSYIISALLRKNSQASRELARNLIDNFIYEMDHYGYPTGSNRGYALTRSQNNIFPTNVWEYYKSTNNHIWLENVGIPHAVKTVEYWKTRIGAISLDEDDTMEGYRWISHGIGPREEKWGSPVKPDPYYYKILYNLVHLAMIPNPARTDYAKGFDFNRVIRISNNNDMENWKKAKALNTVDLGNGDPDLITLKEKTFVLSAEASDSKRDEPAIKLGNIIYTLTPRYYQNDRTAVASGFNPSHLYGPFNAFVDEFIDTAHNIQLYKAHKDIAKMYRALAKHYENRNSRKANDVRENVELYESLAAEIKEMLFKFLWDKDRGAFFNYSYHSHTKRTSYPSASTGYAIWAELFDIEKPEEKKMLMKLIDFMTNKLEGPEGFYISGIETGLSWDKPNVSGIQQGMIVAGLKKYAVIFKEKGMNEESKKFSEIAQRISKKYFDAQLKKGKEIKETATMAAVSDLYKYFSESN